MKTGKATGTISETGRGRSSARTYTPLHVPGSANWRAATARAAVRAPAPTCTMRTRRRSASERSPSTVATKSMSLRPRR